MKKKLVSVYIKMKTALYFGVKEFKNNEIGAVNVVEIVVIIGIAVVLAVLFRRQIQSLLETLFGSINDNAAEAIEN